MANTTFNTRIKLKVDTLANWNSANPVLLKGEIAIVEIPNDIDPIHNAPAVLMKAGDGATAFSELKYISGLAGDVYAWAKAATKPVYTADEISGLSDYISGEIQDTNTTYKIDFADGKVRLFAKEVGGEFGTTPVATAEVPTYTLAEGTANGTVAFNGTDVAVHGLGSAAFAETSAFDAAGAASAVEASVDAKLGTLAEGKTVAEMISDAQTAATYDDSALSTRVQTLENDTRVATLIGDDASKSVRTIANEELAKQLIPEGAKESLDTLAEIAAWIQAHPDDAAAMNADIASLKVAIGEGGSVDSQIAAKITALDLANTYDAKGAADTAKSEAIAAAKTAADAAYVAKEDGKGLSTNDYDATAKAKVDAIEEGAQVNKIEEIEVNGVAATVADKKATVNVSLDKIDANTAENYVIFDCGNASSLI